MSRKNAIAPDGSFVDFGRKLTKAEKKKVKKERRRFVLDKARAQGKTGGR